MKGLRPLLLAGGLILCTGLGLSVAQNINRSLQQSQDPSGPFAVDSNSNVYFPNKLLTANQNSPTLTSCGTTPAITGTDVAGTVTHGSGAGAIRCLVTFNQVYLATPFCVVTARTFTTATPISYVPATTGITVTHGVTSAAGGLVYDYFCTGSR